MKILVPLIVIAVSLVALFGCAVLRNTALRR
jgi:hypothetical protein